MPLHVLNAHVWGGAGCWIRGRLHVVWGASEHQGMSTKGFSIMAKRIRYAGHNNEGGTDYPSCLPTCRDELTSDPVSSSRMAQPKHSPALPALSVPRLAAEVTRPGSGRGHMQMSINLLCGVGLLGALSPPCRLQNLRTFQR